MNRIKTFEQYNTQDGEMLKEEFLDNTKTKIEKFLENPSDEEMANKLLQQCFVTTFSNKITQPLKQKVRDLPMEQKVQLLKDALEKLEYSPVISLRLLQHPISGKLKVGSITNKKKKKEMVSLD